MNKSASNITVLPRYMVTLPLVEEKSSPSIIVLTAEGRDEGMVKDILGDSCELTMCSSLRDLSQLLAKSRNTQPDLVLVRNLLIQKNPRTLKAIEKRVHRQTPLLVLTDKTDEKYIARYMESGVRDAVSLDEAERLRAVVSRELEDHRIRCAYERAISCTAKYRRQLKRLTGQNVTIVSPRVGVTTRFCDRASFMKHFLTRLAESPSRGVRALAWIRPDRFKDVQESVGILASEEALAHLASVLQELLHPTDLFGRIGGTVFAVLVERGTMRDVEAWLQQFCRSLNERPFITEGKSVRLSCTVGICEIGEANVSVERVLKEAQNACQRGRLRGEGQIFLSASSKSARSVRSQDRKWAKRIQSALQKDCFRLLHSPVVRLNGHDDKIRDTWVRMIDEKGNTILAAKFVPVAIRLGLMTNIDRWVIAATLTYCTKLKPDLVFVRLSRNSVLDESLAGWLEKILKVSTVKPSQICFQVTETVAVRHMKQVISQSIKLARLGFQFAIEQVGATPDMKKVLHLVPTQYARIDAALLQQVAWDKSVRNRVSEIVSSAKERGIHVVADRVEDAATMAVLCQMEVDFMQGDYVLRDSIVMEDASTICTPILPPAIACRD